MKIVKSSIRLMLVMPAMLAIAGMILLICPSNAWQHQPMSDSFDESSYEDLPELEAKIDTRFLIPGINKINETDAAPMEKVKICTVPHHDLAAEMIAQEFNLITRSQEVQTIFIIGPNHSDHGNSPAISSKVSWQTEFGQVSQDNVILDQLQAQGFITFDDENFAKEHSIKTILPFIRYYLPQAKIVPIILNTKHDFRMSDEFSSKLTEYLQDEKTILISTIDFSHYLSTKQANANDEETLTAIRERNYDFMSAFNNDYFDSPATLVTTVLTADKLKSDKMEIIRHANSGDFVGGDIDISTGYFTVCFR